MISLSTYRARQYARDRDVLALKKFTFLSIFSVASLSTSRSAPVCCVFAELVAHSAIEFNRLGSFECRKFCACNSLADAVMEWQYRRRSGIPLTRNKSEPESPKRENLS